MSKSVRVLHVHSGNMFGGVERILVNLATYGQDAAAMESTFMLCFDGPLRKALADAKGTTALLAEVRVRKPWTIYQARRRLEQHLQTNTYDAIVTHSPWAHALFAPVARRYPTKLVFWIHGSLSGRHWLERWARRIPPDLLLCNSKFTARAATNLFPNCAPQILYPPVTPPDRPTMSQQPDVRAELATPTDATVITHAGRMEVGKGHEVLLKSLQQLKDLPDWHCWVVGGPNSSQESAHWSELHSLCDKLRMSDRVRFLGHRTDIARILQATDVYCQPNTLPEGFGMTFIEAMYAQVPIVTSAFGGAAEILDEDLALFVPPGDIQGCARVLRQLITDPALRNTLGSGGAKRARELCDPAQQTMAFATYLRAL